MTASAHIFETVKKESVPAHIIVPALEYYGEIDSIVETEDERRTRLSVYHEIKHLLIAKVIPEHEIAFVHDYDGSAAMVELSRKLNAGEMRIVLASTTKLGSALIFKPACMRHTMESRHGSLPGSSNVTAAC
jgi:hypothetical protein